MRAAGEEGNRGSGWCGPRAAWGNAKPGGEER